LYDALGSALFDAICRLPWYAITRAELRLLARDARELFDRAAPVSRIIELGPGNGEKLKTLLGGVRPTPRGIDLHLVDVSPAALGLAGDLLSAFPGIRVFTHEHSYEAGLVEASRTQRGQGRTLVMFLGSNIGNFDRPAAEAFLRNVRAALAPGDAFLIGADLIKPERRLVLAYADPLGVTAAFNRNLLCRINRELGGNFDVRRFLHRAIWNRADARIEMDLVSLGQQRVHIQAAGIDTVLGNGERIWTESSYKFDPDDIVSRLEHAGFTLVRQWIDRADLFALTLATAC
jgi:dimethylhistidine N-methyltransferase